MAGRPTLYREELVEKILEALIDGDSLRQICERQGMPNRKTVMRWQEEHPDFATRCARARDLAADAEEEEMAAIERKVLAGSVDPKAASVVLASKRWRAEKKAPKRYGNRVAMDVEGRLTLEQLVAGTAAAAQAASASKPEDPAEA